MANLQYTDDNWLGEVPAHWPIVPSKSLFANPVERNRGDDIHLTPSQKFGVIPQSEYMEITGSRVVLNLSGADNMRHVEPGDYVSHLRSFQGGLEYSPYKGKVSSAYTVLRPKRQIEPRFYKYLFKSGRYVQGLATTTEQLRDGQSIRYQQFSLLPLPYPPLEEQRAVADFLDRELSQIDQLVSRQRSFISLLTERQNSLCHQVISTGLGIGSVTPNYWTKNRVSRLFKAEKGPNAAQLSLEFCATVPGPFPVYSGQTDNDGIMAEIDSYAFDSGEEDVLFTTTVGAKAMTVMRIKGKFSLSQNCMIIRNISKGAIDTDFAFWHFKVLFGQKKAEISSHMQASFRMSDLRKFEILVPPLAEQLEIAAYLNESQRVSSLLAEKANALIDSLLERRKALVNAAVTGKIDVRGKI